MEKTTIDAWSVRDLEDNSTINVTVLGCPELGNQSLPGVQVIYMGNIINYEPLIAERWAYQASKAGVDEYLLEDKSWMVHDDQFVKTYLVLGSPLKAKVEVKTRNSKVITKEYELPFSF